MKKKIGIFDADLMDNGTRHPNLALMKIAGYHIEKDYEVRLLLDYNLENLDTYEIIYMSKVFSFTNVPDKILSLPNLQIGGTGFYEVDDPWLPDEMEHHMPYYDLYKDYCEKKINEGNSRTKYEDYLDYSIGFATRGCFRHCEFCVNRKYDSVFRHAMINEFLDEDRPAIYLWDDNVLGFSDWEEVIDELEATGKPFQFRQGIDLRLITDEKAKRFNQVKYRGDFIFAFDHLKDRNIIIKNVQLWKRYSSKVCKMYVLSGYESQDENDLETVFERISILMKYGSLPYIMRYIEYKSSSYKSMYIELARWCNQPQFFKKKSFREFCIANQEYKKDQSSYCSAYKAMIDFEKKFPDLAKKYFDLKFESENQYKVQYGYGRKYANKPLCSLCKSKGCYWDSLSNLDEKELIKKYFTKEIDLLCLSYATAECEVDKYETALKLINIINKYTFDEIIEILKQSENLEKVEKDNIPQFSSFEKDVIKVNKVLVNKAKELTFAELGAEIDKKESKPDALKKYGENHSKLATQLDLAQIHRSGKSSYVKTTEIGKIFNNLGTEEKKELIYKLSLRIPIIQRYFVEELSDDQLKEHLSCLANTTISRRKSSVNTILKSLNNYRKKGR